MFFLVFILFFPEELLFVNDAAEQTELPAMPLG